MTRLISILIFIQFWSPVLGQYHPMPDEQEYEKLLMISEKAYKKSGLPPYATSLIIFYGDLGCDDPLTEKVANKPLFEQGIKFAYYNRKKCLFKREKYLAAIIFYLNNEEEILAYVDGEAVITARLKDGHHMYPEKEEFIQFLISKGYQNVFSLGCSLGQFKYYATNTKGEAVLLDEFVFRHGKNPALNIDELE